MSVPLRRSPDHRFAAPLAVAVVAGGLVLASLDPTGQLPGWPEGPGLTIDESFNAREGVRLVIGLEEVTCGRLDLWDVFGTDKQLGPFPEFGYHLADHPPLGRLWIGLSHELAAMFLPWWPDNTPRPDVDTSPSPHGGRGSGRSDSPPRNTPTQPSTIERKGGETPPASVQAEQDRPLISAVCARTASATAFALTVLLIGCVAARWYGGGAGLVASVAVVLMPQLFGHAHLAALETFIGLTYAAAALVVADLWSGPSPPRHRVSALSGLVFGLALLTKIQAALLPLPIAVWAVWRWRQRAVVPLLVWGATALLLFFIGWPWLWLDPIGHLVEYFGRTTLRVELKAWYLGRSFVDRDVPWHYPLVMFLTTVPIGLHALAMIGVASRERPAWRTPREALLAGCIVVPPLVFSVPSVPVYDGPRLFLVVFPLWAIFAGRGCVTAFEWLGRRFARSTSAWILAGLLACQAYGLLAMWPCHLSYYNLLVGGLRGAERLGFDPSYWGDSVTRSLLRDVVQVVPRDSTIAVFPRLHTQQWEFLAEQSPLLRRHGVRLVPFSPQAAEQAGYVLIFRRHADLPGPEATDVPEAFRGLFRDPASHVRPLAALRREGVLLAVLWRWPPH